jgi:hypothetical protein
MVRPRSERCAVDVEVASCGKIVIQGVSVSLPTTVATKGRAQSMLEILPVGQVSLWLYQEHLLQVLLDSYNKAMIQG